MKIYIPFNSNDFNNIFSTLTISPVGFYPLRNFGFKRASSSIFNNLQYTLIGYNVPIFSRRDFSENDGYVINLEVESDTEYPSVKTKGVTYYEITDTVFLFKGFRLIFRSEFELRETFARSLKSIETKFTGMAKRHSVLAKEFGDILWVETSFKFKGKDDLRNTISFEKERRINKVLGTTLGFFIGLNNSVGGEFGKLKALKRELENLSTIFSNSVNSKTDNGEKERLLNCLNEIYSFYEHLESLNETLLLNSIGLSSTLFSDLLSSTIYGVSILDLIKSGLTEYNFEILPMQLKIDVARRCIESKYNIKYPDSYLSRIDDILLRIRRDINDLINDKKSKKDFNEDELFILTGATPIAFKSESAILSKEKKYLEFVIDFFVNQDYILNVETFFSERGAILSQLGNHLKLNISEFDNSDAKKFLLNLFDSFKNLRSAFKANAIESEVFRSLAVLFTTGRDLYKYFDNVIYAGVENLNVPLSIWGSVYGYSSIPKTYTEEFFNTDYKGEILTKVFQKNLMVILEKEKVSKDATETNSNSYSVHPSFGNEKDEVENTYNSIEIDEHIDYTHENVKSSYISETQPEINQEDAKFTLSKKLSSFEIELRKDSKLDYDEIVVIAKRAFAEIYEPLSFENISDDNFTKLLKSSLKMKAKKTSMLTADVIKRVMVAFKNNLEVQK